MQHDIVTDPRALCRVCMTPEMEDSANLFDPDLSGQNSLHEMLQVICAPVFAKSGPEGIMPTKVCLTCRNATVAAYSLHLQCIETDRQLSELVALMWELQGPGEDEIVQDGEDLTMSSSKEETVQEAKQDSSWRENAEDKTCLGCGKTFSTRWTLTRHKKEGWCDMTIDPKKRTCDICNKVLRTVHLMKRHRDMHGSIDDAKQTLSDEPRITQQLSEPVPTQGHASEVDSLSEEIPLLNNENVNLIKVEALDLIDDNDNEEEDSNALDIQCTICGTSFTSRRAYEKHTKEGNCLQSETFPCMVCGKIFDKNSRLHYHMISHKKRFECSRCNETFKSKLGLHKHMKRINRCSAVQANTIQAVFQTKHKSEGWNKNDVKQRTCDICYKVLRSVELLKRHRDMHDSIDEAKQTTSDKPCPASEIPATTQGHTSQAGEIPLLNIENVDFIKVEAPDLMDENDNDNDNEEEANVLDIQCTDCGISFTSRRARDRHIQEGNCQRSQTFPCIICGKIFDKQTRLQYHLYSHTKRFECSRCNETFKSKLGLHKHMKRINQCSGREEVVNAGESLVVEMQTQQGNPAEMTGDGQCNRCGVTFLSARAHRDHTKKRNCLRKQTYPCKKCGKVFDTQSRLSYHMFSHRERVACSQCDETFRYRGALLKHIKYKRCSGNKVSTSQQDQMQGEEGNAEDGTYESFDVTMQAQEGDTYVDRIEQGEEQGQMQGEQELAACIKRENSEEPFKDQETETESLVVEMRTLERDTAISSQRTHKMHSQAGNQKPIFPCPICGKIFYKLARMRYHRRNHQERTAACRKASEDSLFKTETLEMIKVEGPGIEEAVEVKSEPSSPSTMEQGEQYP